ncbi:MAG: TMEM175 family protein [Verrucomicrobiota bacterium]|nr:TMEM175 family protein [Verrucomicrobiota bacterium]
MHSKPAPGVKGTAASPIYGERFTQRLEAFSDLVFGFSLSLLATRLDVPADPAEVFETTRWATFIVTFAMICAIWLSHYRIFRHHFVVRTPDVIVNFIFLLGIAVLPYVVQTFLRFTSAPNVIVLYLGDFAVILTALATLRWRALRQRRDDPDADVRLREWRGTVRQYILVLVIVGFLFAMNAQLFPAQKFFSFLPVVLVIVTLGTRLSVRRLPRFLDAART